MQRVVNRELSSPRHEARAPIRALSIAAQTLVPLVGLASLAYSAYVQVGSIAVYHDELWNYPAAVAMLRGESIVPTQEIRILGRPLALVSGPYQGAIKSWLLVPALGLLGTTPSALRGVNVVFGFVYLLSLYWALRAFVPRCLASAVFLLPVLDPNLLVFVPTDQGPFLVQCIFMALAVGAFLRVVLTQDWRYLAAALFCSATVVADKLTAVPFTFAFLAIGLTWLWPYRRQLITGKTVMLLVLASLLPLVPNILYFLRNGMHDLLANTLTNTDTLPPYLTRMMQNAQLFLRDFFNGRLLLQGLLQVALTPRLQMWFPLLGFCLLLMSPVGLIQKHFRASSWRIYLFCPTLFIGVFVVFTAIPGLNRPWHYFTLHTAYVLAVFGTMPLVIGFATAMVGSRLAKSIACIMLWSLVIQGGIVAGRYLAVTRNVGGVNLTSYALYHVQDILESLGAKRVVCLSYSIGNPLYVLTAGHLHFVDMTWAPFSNGQAAELIDLLSEPGSYAVWRRSVTAPGVPDAWLEWLNRGTDWFRALPQDTFAEITVEDARGTEFGIVYLESNQ